MKIAQIAPLIESVPPRLYGGTERVVSYLTEELVAQGHDVTLFASGDSITRAKLVPCSTVALRLDTEAHYPIPRYMMMLDKVLHRAPEFDILHFHLDHLHFPLFRTLANRTVTTLHGRQDITDSALFYHHFRHVPLVSISDSQRCPIPKANFIGTVYHGIPLDLYRPSRRAKGDYLAFLGRISPEKDPVKAIKLARALNMKLKIAAKVDVVDEDYFREQVSPLLNDPNVDFIGELNEQQKGEFLRDARALLFTIDWPEPFGLVMIEAMACGTPVLAFDCGSVREVIDDGVTGRVVKSFEEAVMTWPQVAALDRRKVRQRFEKRFSARRMANGYVQLYQKQLSQTHSEHLRAAADEVMRVNGDGLVADAGLHVE
ncbi:MAG TPA: glycosyltransferase family 4 protein [Methyloceanibacter sp.]|jgi:glycosyltransferase involved in cell wall biosynthesis|nr:glycosyltransferase family 4 protein [Methyloceanibacter sp.]